MGLGSGPGSGGGLMAKKVEIRPAVQISGDMWEGELWIEDPTSSDSFPIGIFTGLRTLEFVGLWFSVDAGTIDFNLEARPYTAAFSAGTDLLAADSQATTTGKEDFDFAAPLIPSKTHMRFVASAASGSPTELILGYAYLIGK